MFLNVLDFLICLSKNEYGWINLEHARICLKYNVKDAVKSSIFKREVHSELYQDGGFVKMFNMVLWIYVGVWICLW